ncbi:Glycosyltransferase involved in cell wall bisynthesis [Hyunsoonleella jejuensis]|uniref:Glycosyltransferase involved in cell wall bisynthesis n=1 Tax=Hyunsoonleella jejuensis TaxID=419940 RepID=A0A1H9J9R0_9FLAO|nr:glycosyltransferase family 2 protein [Hyunsoonleella jejuensis]SEQ83527.1 Glycosyltransferase involved in cell wall bisynthesis [Hyunsoonleella jejuensis]
MPFFSVVIPLYNKGNYIKATLQTIVNQTFNDFEIIIINDGSTDNSREVVTHFSDSRIKLIDQENQGLSRARNAGIKNASGNYIALIDADDFWLPHHLKQLHNLIIDFPNAGLYSTGYTLKKSEHIYHRAKFNGLPDNFRGIVPNFFKHSLQNCIAWVGSVCFPKNVLDDVGYFDLDIFSEQDTDMYIKVALKYDVALDNTSISSIYNRTMDDNMSNFSQKRAIPKLLYTYKHLEAKNSHLKTYLDYNRFSTIIYFKLSSNDTLAKQLIADVDFKNLNNLQRLLIRLPNSIVKFLFFVKTKLKLNALRVFRPKKEH